MRDCRRAKIAKWESEYLRGRNTIICDFYLSMAVLSAHLLKRKVIFYAKHALLEYYILLLYCYWCLNINQVQMFFY